jgi:hypothetical protein
VTSDSDRGAVLLNLCRIYNGRYAEKLRRTLDNLVVGQSGSSVAAKRETKVFIAHREAPGVGLPRLDSGQEVCGKLKSV